MPLIGQSIIAEQATDPAVALYGPWFSRETDAATFALQILYISTNGQLTVAIEHKNVEDADSSATTVATFTTATAAGAYIKEASGLKELVRFRYEPISSSGADWIHYRMTPPIWQPN